MPLSPPLDLQSPPLPALPGRVGVGAGMVLPSLCVHSHYIPPASLPHAPTPLVPWGLSGGSGQLAITQGLCPSLGDNAREDLHAPNCGERCGCQVRPRPALPEPRGPAPHTVSCSHQHHLCFRDAIAKVLYALLFSWLITRVNALVSPRQDTLSIAILDIYGFEVGPCRRLRGGGHRQGLTSLRCLGLPFPSLSVPAAGAILPS